MPCWTINPRWFCHHTWFILLCNIFLIVLLNKWTMSLMFILCNNFFHWKPLIAFLIWSTFAFLKCYTSRSYWSGKINFKINLENTIWWWKFWCKEHWKPDFITKFDWEAKIKSLQKDLSPKIVVPSWISCFSLNEDVIPSVLRPT